MKVWTFLASLRLLSNSIYFLGYRTLAYLNNDDSRRCSHISNIGDLEKQWKKNFRGKRRKRQYQQGGDDNLRPLHQNYQATCPYHSPHPRPNPAISTTHQTVKIWKRDLIILTKMIMTAWGMTYRKESGSQLALNSKAKMKWSTFVYHPNPQDITHTFRLTTSTSKPIAITRLLPHPHTGR